MAPNLRSIYANRWHEYTNGVGQHLTYEAAHDVIRVFVHHSWTAPISDENATTLPLVVGR